MKRRGFVCLVVGGIVGAALPSDGQNAGTTPTVLYVAPGSPECKATQITEAFLQGFRDAGYVPGSTVMVATSRPPASLG
jgi:hypothetical protein